mgnify:CR=1 FL=1
MTLTDEQFAARRIGGSDAAIIMKGENFGKTPFTLWEEKTGRREPEDLTWLLRAQMGVTTEDLNRRWYTHETNHAVFTKAGEGPLSHPEYSYITANLDGVCVVGEKHGVFEAKHTGAFSKADPAESYYPQLQHYMAVTGYEFAHLSVFKGTDTWSFTEVLRDPDYIAQLIERESAFWWCVESDTPPEGYEPVATPIIDPEKVVPMEGNNLWATFATDWLDNRDAAKQFEGAIKGIKTLVEADVARAHGHGIEATRTKRGVSIREISA